jgi:DNA-binding response OmpR family regulator
MPRPRVLVVTEDTRTAELIRGTLTTERCDVDTVSRGAAAIGQFTQQHYDLLISNLRLPDLGGHEFYWALRTRWPAAFPRVVFLAHAGASIPPSALGLTALEAPVLLVPFTLAALRDVVRRALGVP